MGFQDVRLNSKDLPNKLILLLKNNWEESLKAEPGFNDLRNFSGFAPAIAEREMRSVRVDEIEFCLYP